MRVHHYDPANGVFTGSTDARPDPAEWELARKAAYDAAHAPAVAQVAADRAAAEDAYAQAMADLDQALASFRDADEDDLEEARDAYRAAALDAELARQSRDATLAALSEQLVASDAAARQAAEAIEPSVFMLPAHATFIEPPELSADERAVFADGAWTVEAIPPEAEPELPPEPDLAAEARFVRDRRIADVRWLIERHVDQRELGLETTLSEGGYLLVLQYVQDLRDVPLQPGFPAVIDWPELDVAGT